MEYCCHVWDGAPSCYLELLEKLQKRIRRTVGFSLAASLEPLNHCQNVASLSLFYRYYFGRYNCWRNTCYSDTLHNFWLFTIHNSRMHDSYIDYPNILPLYWDNLLYQGKKKYKHDMQRPNFLSEENKLGLHLLKIVIFFCFNIFWWK